MKRLILILIITGLTFMANGAELSLRQKQAFETAETLATEGQWLRLMHFNGSESTIDSASFFLAPDGKINPTAELKATLSAFFNNEKQCLFPARYAWLSEKFGTDLLPAIKCADYEKFKKDLNFSKTSLIYASSYLGNPASYFGHTLLRLDAKEKLPLLSHAVNYGALTGKDQGLFYALRGVMGAYKGIFTVYPYYDTVNLYNNMENRDIWEYELNLTPEQTEFLTAHIWELGHQWAQYYFFSENCSYMILETLNVVAPDQNWTQELPFFTLPSDTVRLILKQNNLLSSAKYRPSRQTRLTTAYQSLDSTEKKQLKALIANPAVVITGSDDRKAILYETAYEYLQYRFVSEQISQSILREQSLAYLNARNALKTKAKIPEPPVPEIRPDQAHLPSSVSALIGKSNHENFAEITVRPVLHSLMDKSDGFVPYNGIDYLKTTLRYDDKNHISLRRLDLIDIASYSPVNALFQDASFHFTLGQNRFFYSPSGKDISVFNAKASVGYSFLIGKYVNFFAMAATNLATGSVSNAGIGAATGFFADIGLVRIYAAATPMFYTHSKSNTVDYAAKLSVSVFDNVNWVSEASFINGKYKDKHEIKSGFQIHF